MSARFSSHFSHAAKRKFCGQFGEEKFRLPTVDHMNEQIDCNLNRLTRTTKRQKMQEEHTWAEPKLVGGCRSYSGDSNWYGRIDATFFWKLIRVRWRFNWNSFQFKQNWNLKSVSNGIFPFSVAMGAGPIIDIFLSKREKVQNTVFSYGDLSSGPVRQTQAKPINSHRNASHSSA